jgi:hypothetical protein
VTSAIEKIVRRVRVATCRLKAKVRSPIAVVVGSALEV